MMRARGLLRDEGKSHVRDPDEDTEEVDVWQVSKADARELFAEHRGKRLRIFLSAAYTTTPVHFVYCNGVYLGCEVKLKDAKRLAKRGKPKPDVEKPAIDTTDMDLSNDQLGIPLDMRLTPAERKQAWLQHHTAGRSRLAMLEFQRRMALPQPEPEYGGRRENRGRRGQGVGKPAIGPGTDATIHRLRQGNPKREGSDAWRRWETLFSYDGKTVAAYKAAKHNMTTLRNAIAKRWVEVKE